MPLEQFYTWLKLNKNSQRTVDGYFQQVNCFGKFCDYQFTQGNLDRYLIKLREEEKSNATINSFKIAMIAYSNFANISLQFPKWKKTKRGNIKFYFTEKDMEEVLKNYYEEKDLLLRFMFYTGVRPSALLKLKVEDINFDKKDIHIYNAKGNKDRVIPFLNNKFYNDLKTHCKNVEGKVFSLSYDKINRMFKEIKRNLKIDGVVEPRTMRISFAKYCIAQGMDVLYLKKLMGHTNIKITELYAEPDERMVKEACEKIRKRKRGGE